MLSLEMREENQCLNPAVKIKTHCLVHLKSLLLFCNDKALVQVDSAALSFKLSCEKSRTYATYIRTYVCCYGSRMCHASYCHWKGHSTDSVDCFIWYFFVIVVVVVIFFFIKTICRQRSINLCSMNCSHLFFACEYLKTCWSSNALILKFWSGPLSYFLATFK